MAESKLRGDLTEMVSQMEMLKILECPVCMETPFPPIYMCLTGHSICKVCKPALSECPICKSNISDTRNYIAESVILSSNHACCFKKYGCPIILKGDLIENHVGICEFKGLKCPFYKFDDCLMTLLKMSEVKHHVNSMHRLSILPNSVLYELSTLSIFSNHIATQLSSLCEKTKIGNYRRGGVIIQYDGNIFICAQLQRNSKLIWFICLVGSEENAKKYKGKVKITPAATLEHSKNQKFKMSWTLPMNSIMTPTTTGNNFDDGIFKACYDWDDLKLNLGNNNNLKTFDIDTTYKISKR